MQVDQGEFVLRCRRFPPAVLDGGVAAVVDRTIVGFARLQAPHEPEVLEVQDAITHDIRGTKGGGGGTDAVSSDMGLAIRSNA